MGRKIDVSLPKRKLFRDMTNRSRTQGSAPPYVSYKSWETFLAYLRTELMPLPQRLDPGVWRNLPMSGTTMSAIQGALIFLGLTDTDYAPTDRLEALVQADTVERKHRALRNLIQDSYVPILGGMDLQRATRGQVRQAFQNAGSGAQTSEKAVTFFVSVARDAGMEVHQSLVSRNQISRSRRRNVINRNENTEKTTLPKIEPKNEPAQNGTEKTTELETKAPDGIHLALAGLLGELPKIGERWTVDSKNRFKMAFMATLDVIYPTSDEADAQS